MAIDANRMQQALAVILKSWEEKGTPCNDSKNDVRKLRKNQHEETRGKQTERLHIEHSTQNPSLDQKNHARDDGN